MEVQGFARYSIHKKLHVLKDGIKDSNRNVFNKTDTSRDVLSKECSSRIEKRIEC